MASPNHDCIVPQLPAVFGGHIRRTLRGRQYVHSGLERTMPLVGRRFVHSEERHGMSMPAIHYGKDLHFASYRAGEGSDPDQYYSIDGKVGSTVARQLRAGSKLHIGRNGELQSETLRVKKWRCSSKK